jgi:hypothetical protein
VNRLESAKKPGNALHPLFAEMGIVFVVFVRPSTGGSVVMCVHVLKPTALGIMVAGGRLFQFGTTAEPSRDRPRTSFMNNVFDLLVEYCRAHSEESLLDDDLPLAA